MGSSTQRSQSIGQGQRWETALRDENRDYWLLILLT